MWPNIQQVGLKDAGGGLMAMGTTGIHWAPAAA